MFTVEDFKEMRAGLLKLDGHHVYVGSRKVKEPCAHCSGKGKTQSQSRTGRKVWQKCSVCWGEGHVNPLRNVELTVPKTGWSCTTMELSLQQWVDRMNDHAKAGLNDYLTQPTYVTILD
jgi:DnaJ-class molecular chaperone